MAANPSTARTEFFRELKPRCVSINDLAVRASDKRAVAKQLITVTEDLANVLNRQVSKDATVLDEKLADYVFFPLSNILRNQQDFPVRLTELTITCLATLIQYGWKAKIAPELAQQLLILLTFIIGGVPGKERKDPVPEETKIEALKALNSLIKATGLSSPGAKSLVEDKNLPALGHTITVILDHVADGATPEIQLQALQALDAMCASIKDHQALATFLPGMISCLTRLLAPPSSRATSRKVLVRAISTLKSVLTGVLSDLRTSKILKKDSGSDSVSDTETKSNSQVLSTSWLKATADQIKLALASILKLRTHESEDVRFALERLCIALLDECHKSLSSCAPILVESAMILSSESDNQSLLSTGLNTTLADLTSIYPELTDVVKTTMYNWVTSLPTITLSNNEDIKRQAVHNLWKGQQLMSTLRIDSSTLSDTLAAALRDSVTTLITSGGPKQHLSELPSDAIELDAGSLVRAETGQRFRPLLMNNPAQEGTRDELLAFIAKSGSLLNQGKLASDMLEYVHESLGATRVASYWLTFELVKAGMAQSSSVDEFLDFGPTGGNEYEQILAELYSFSVTTLNSDEELDDVDWRLQSIALEVTTYAASRMGFDFRPELIDVLYPMATNLGSAVPQVREHAIVALNSIATSCGYHSVADLIIDNVDYMLNSISLRLNTFDISPTSTQVLRMMIKLTGPRLIPFMDDVVASIFGALENYHGYTLLVENLFGVLSEIVYQGAESDTLLLEDERRTTIDHVKRPRRMVEIEEITDFLDKRSERKRRRQEETDITVLEPHPKAPWKSSKDENEKTGDDDEDEDEDDQPSQEVEKKLPKTATYTLLERITSLTQHYLTSPTPSLRRALLELLTTVFPALAPDEEAFLPLVNAVWPVLLLRLYDQEAFVVIAACKALTALFAAAGDFLSSRIETEWWEKMGKWCARAQANAKSRGSPSTQRSPKSSSSTGTLPRDPSAALVIPIRSGRELHARDSSSTGPIARASGGLGDFTQAAQIWEAVQGLLISIVTYVRIDDKIFDQLLDILSNELLHMPEEARRALEAVNEDAVWLCLYERGAIEIRQPRPEVNGVNFVSV